jgi:hypothetical protein
MTDGDVSSRAAKSKNSARLVRKALALRSNLNKRKEREKAQKLNQAESSQMATSVPGPSRVDN